MPDDKQQQQGQSPRGSSQRQDASEKQEQAGDSQGIPLAAGQKQQEQAVRQQIDNFETELANKSNSELREIATKLESAEREMLLEKIDQELQLIKETVVKPGDGAADASAAASAGAAAVVVNEPANS